MKGILLAGLLEREAAAIEIMVDMGWRDLGVVTRTRLPTLQIPEQDADARACGCCIVDLSGLSMRRYSSGAEVRLLQFLGGRPAVLLVWGNGGGWLEQELPLSAGQLLEFLTVPYSNQSLRAVLERVTVAARRQTPSKPELPPPGPDAMLRPKLPAWERALDLPAQTEATRHRADHSAGAQAPARPSTTAASSPLANARKRRALPMPAWKRVLEMAEQGLVHTGHQHTDERAAAQASTARASFREGAAGAPHGHPLFQAFPELGQRREWRLLHSVLSAQAAQLYSINGNTVFMVDRSAGWLASNHTASELVRLQQTGRLVEQLQVVDVPADRVAHSLEQNFGERRADAQQALGDILWELAGDALGNTRLRLAQDVALHMRSFPNFTSLERVGPLDIQLASICARLPQTAYSLLRSFVRNEQDVLRFLACALASEALYIDAVATMTGPPATGGGPGHAAKRGFFKSLLKKIGIG